MSIASGICTVAYTLATQPTHQICEEPGHAEMYPYWISAPE